VSEESSWAGSSTGCAEGLAAVEALLAQGDPAGTALYCHGDSPTWRTAAWCRRCSMLSASASTGAVSARGAHPRALRRLPAFAAAHPSQQPDAE
jgi:maleylacetoacetate isomerase/maleylpyruvate isomerase